MKMSIKKAANAAFFQGDLQYRTGKSRLRSGFCARFVVFLVEFLNATSGVHDFLRPGVERVAFRTNFNVQRWFANCGLGLESIAATAGHGDFGILWVSVCFHLGFPGISNWCGK
jgi:hypothetical protein